MSGHINIINQIHLVQSQSQTVLCQSLDLARSLDIKLNLCCVQYYHTIMNGSQKFNTKTYFYFIIMRSRKKLYVTVKRGGLNIGQANMTICHDTICLLQCASFTIACHYFVLDQILDLAWIIYLLPLSSYLATTK